MVTRPHKKYKRHTFESKGTQARMECLNINLQSQGHREINERSLFKEWKKR